ncbi:MAG: type II toxin-antitoxin system HicB family antitoxin [Lachnospiraceae bacterium]|nr:type II toxin-antitoxin system HicB family antitoxin [Lachnospiraceae bacterium]
MNQTGYEVIIWWSAEKRIFLAEVPELNGCTAEGASLQEAAKATEDKIEAWIAESLKLGREIPRPRGRLLYA